MIKVIGGKYKRSNLKQPPESITRPTKDMVKGALFNIIGDVTNKTFLDLFGGSGSISIEASSRGASEVYTIDKNKEAIKVINENIQKLNIGNITVKQTDYLKALEFFKTNNINFDFIFVDPPYNFNIDVNFVDLICSYNILKEDGIIVLETEKDIAEENETYSIRSYKYGRTYLIKFQKK